MADGTTAAAAAERAVDAAGGVANQAASGNAWAFVVFVLLLFAGLTGLWIWRSTAAKPKADPPKPSGGPEPSCKPTSPDGCPAIQALAIRIDTYAKQLEADREERREHRAEIREAVKRLHERTDELYGKAVMRPELEIITDNIRHFQEEASRTFAAVSELVASVHPQRRTTKRSA